MGPMEHISTSSFGLHVLNSFLHALTFSLRRFRL